MESIESSVGERLRIFRASKKMTRPQMAEALGGSTPGYRSNEQGTSLPNSKLLIGLRGLGLNINWLLSGDGPMLRADLNKSAPAKINADALVRSLELMIRAASADESLSTTVRNAVEYYMYLIDMGKIPPDGIGDGNLSNAA